MVESAAVRRPWATIITCALLAYGVSLLGTFVYDDLHSVRDNEALRSLANVPRFFCDLDAFSAIDNRMYRPVLLVSYALDWALGHGAAWMFKLTNLLIHIGAAGALRALACRLGAHPRAALVAACLFAVHPLASEAINTVSGRSELLLVLGLVGGALAHLRAKERVTWSLLTAVCAGVACGSKETGVVLPALLLVLDPPWRGRGRMGRWLLAHGLPMAVVLGYLFVRRSLFGVATADVPALVGGADVTAGHGRDLVTQLCTIATVLPRALAQCVVPVGLTLDPDVVFLRTAKDPAVVAGAVFVLALTWLGLRRPSTGPARAFGTALAWASALPWVILPLNSPYLEHRMYGPLAGLALVAAHSLSGVRLALPAWRCAVAAVALALSALAAHRSYEYRDARVLWERVVATQPGSVRGLCGLALCHMERGGLEPALRLLERAVAIWPSHAAALRNLTELHILLSPQPGRALAAVVLSDRLVAAEPYNPFDRLLSSRALAALGAETGNAAWFDAAEAQALTCLEIAPPKGLVFRTAASARARQGRVDLALALLDRSLALGLAHSSVLLDRASYLKQLGRHAEAEQDLARAAVDGPFDPRVIELLRARSAGPGR